MPLKSETVDWIFMRMLARYGSVWIAKWTGVPMEAVKADWAEQLAGMTKDDILYGIQYLPHDFPPTSAAFRALCAKAPESGILKLGNTMTAEEKAAADVVRKRVVAAIHNITPRAA